MNRALPIFLLIALAGAGLAYFALQSREIGPGRPPEADDVLGSRVTAAQADREPPKAAPLAKVETLPAARPKSDLSGEARRWEIFPMNDVGQMLAEAKITATHGDSGAQRTGSGRTTWNSITAGVWHLTIESDGLPTWERDVELARDEVQRTAARLGDKVWLEGTVVDLYGDPVGGVPVYFLRNGVSHPSAPEVNAAREKELGSDEKSGGPPATLIASATSGNGTFQATLPDGGEWRVSVGDPGEARFTQRAPVDYSASGPDRLHIVVPADTQLALNVASKDPDARPTQVTAYRFDQELAARVLESQSAANGVDGGENAIVEKKLEAMRRKAFEAGESEEAVDEAFSRAITSTDGGDGREGRGGIPHKPLFEPGWRPVASASFDSTGVAVLKELPPRDELRFLFIRGRERITTATSVHLVPQRKSEGQLALPPPPADAATADPISLRDDSARVSASPIETPSDEEPGVTVSNAD